MKLRKQNNPEGFYESFSDLIFATMAIFVLLFVIIITQVKPEGVPVSDFEEIAEQLEEAQAMKDEAESKAETLEKELQKALEEKGDVFLLTIINWSEKRDVDMYVIDPAGRVFSYKNKRYNNTPGELSYDVTTGPGTEIWEISNPPKGRYLVYADLFGNGGPATVQGRVYFRNQKILFNRKQLNRSSRDGSTKILLAKIEVLDDAEIKIDRM